ncbi:MAG: exported protein of unknown function [Gammaproteobacteria bacterium]|jgi:hypothetical protein|nr:exported protein of unknown function [Gammaproteobacteria bacterium]
MNRLLLIPSLLMGLFFMLNIYAANQVIVEIKFQQAKNIYNLMTGPLVTNEGAAGHLYRRGKSIVCKYINADMNDSNGRPIPSQDARRYNCNMKFNQDGLALPST